MKLNKYIKKKQQKKLDLLSQTCYTSYEIMIAWLKIKNKEKKINNIKWWN